MLNRPQVVVVVVVMKLASLLAAVQHGTNAFVRLGILERIVKQVCIGQLSIVFVRIDNKHPGRGVYSSQTFKVAR